MKNSKKKGLWVIPKGLFKLKSSIFYCFINTWFDTVTPLL